MAQREDVGSNGAENDIAKVSGDDLNKGVNNLTIHGENNGEPETAGSGLVRDDLYDEPEDLNTQTVIQNRYCFWCHRRGGKTSNNYEESMKQISSFQTVEQFWRIYNHLQRPNEFKTTTDYHLFKNGIKPTWEDPQNERGGKWMVRLKKGLTSRYWEELVLAIIGEQFDVGHEICGAVVSIRHNEDILSVWNKNADNTEAKNKIRDQMRRILRLPSFIAIEYKKHQDSIVDKSSFRNTVVWRSTAAAEGNGRNNFHQNDDNKNSRDNKGDRSGGNSSGGYGSRSNQNSSSSSSSWKTNRNTSGGNDSRAPRDQPNSSKYNNSSSQSSSGGSGSAGAWTKATSGSAARSPWRKTDSASGDHHHSSNSKRGDSKDEDRYSESHD